MRRLAKIARDVRDTDLPQVAATVDRTPIRVTVGAEAGEYEQILHSAMLLFNERGYRDTGMDDIAAAVDMSHDEHLPTLLREGGDPRGGVSACRRPGVG